MRNLVLTIALLALAVTADAAPAEASRDDVRRAGLPHTDTVFEPASYASREAWEQRRAWLRDQVRVASGLWPEPERTPLNARIFGRIDGDGYMIEKVHFESFPGLYVTGNLYRPDPMPAGRVPAVASPHGHWPNGRLHQDEVGDIPARCITLARMGAVVFAYDMIGYNDSGRQFRHQDPALDNVANELWGITSFHVQTWNSIRVLDFLASLPEVDPERIGVTGASGGGTQAFILAAIDDRVKVAAPVNMISHTMQGGCPCENAPGLRIDTNNMEIAALFAPKPLLLISATGDWTRKTPEVEYPFIRSVYELYGEAGKVANVHIDAEHNYNRESREAMYRFFGRHLFGREEADTITEGEIPRFKPEDLLVWTDETAPKDMLSVEQLTEQLKAAATERISRLRPDDARSFRDVLSSGLRWMRSWKSTGPIKVEDRGVMGDPPEAAILRYTYTWGGRSFELARLPAMAEDLELDALILVVHPAGLAARPFRHEQGAMRAYLAPFGTADPPEDDSPRGGTKFFTTFNRTDAAETVIDILTILQGAVPGAPVKSPLHLVAFGELGPVVLVARAMMTDYALQLTDPVTVIDMNGFDIDIDEAYLEGLSIPHIRRLGGLRAIAAAACNGPIWFHDVGDGFDEEWVKAAGRVNGVEVRVTREKADEQEILKWLNAQR